MPTVTELADEFAKKNQVVRDETSKILSELDSIGTEIPTKDQIQEAQFLINEYKKRGINDPEAIAQLEGIINFGKQTNPIVATPEVFNKPPNPVLSAQMDAPVARSVQQPYNPPSETFGNPPLPVLTAQMNAPVVSNEQIMPEIQANARELEYLREYNNQQAGDIANNLIPPTVVNKVATVAKPIPAGKGKKFKSANFSKGASRL